MVLKPWDDRPHPKRGDKNANATYAAVGRAITQGNIWKLNWPNCFRSWLEGSGQVMAHPITPPFELTGQCWEAQQGSR